LRNLETKKKEERRKERDSIAVGKKLRPREGKREELQKRKNWLGPVFRRRWYIRRGGGLVAQNRKKRRKKRKRLKGRQPAAESTSKRAERNHPKESRERLRGGVNKMVDAKSQRKKSANRQPKKGSSLKNRNFTGGATGGGDRKQDRGELT